MSKINLTLFFIITALTLVCSYNAKAQYSQTIKGTVRDQASQALIPGANVLVLSTNPVLGTITDNDGTFKIKNVPVGRYDIQISFIGYETAVIQSVIVTSGKEVILNVDIKESVTTLNEVTVTARSKDKALNSMATLSARTFTVEETGRYAGGLDDPCRLVSSFAGVADGTLQSNGIVVRGNAPFGTGYRIEGITVDNPNHFAGEDFLGGGFVSILSKQVLSNSDFLTGAFPAEYGNALSSVFDMNIKTGNTEQYEHTFQAGVMGIDFASEGPFAKGGKASYLFNYRYSTFGIIHIILPKQTGLPIYQDLSFKFNFPTKAGIFSLWGTGGYESYNFGNEAKKEEESFINDKSGTGVIGIKHKLLLGSTGYITTSIGVNTSAKSNVLKKRWTDLNYYWDEKMDDIHGKYIISTCLNEKISPRLVLRTGIVAENLFYRINNNKSPAIPNPMEQIVDAKGGSNLLQAYLQIKYDILQNLSLNTGIHEQYFMLNNSHSTEPRAGIRWSVNDKNTLSFAYGRHSQIQMLNIYFVEQANPTVAVPNKNLGMIKADHFIAGYDLRISQNIHLKLEPYYQYLFNVPVEENSAFSIINLIDVNTFSKTLVNKGTGRNTGIDFTFEQFLSDGFYYLFTASAFDSKFKGGDGIERNTIYNKHFIINLLGGKEWKVKMHNVLSINSRLYINGGSWISPVEYSDQANPSAFFTSQQPANYRFDVSAGYTINRERYNTIWSVQILNVLDSKCPLEPNQDVSANQFSYTYGRVILPSVSWKIEF